MELSFFITKTAEEKICEILQSEPKGSRFRICVQSGGCSGFQYKFLTDSDLHEDDKIFSQNGAEIAIDNISLSFLESSTLDYLKDLSGEKFTLTNPNAANSCGCGNSFSV